MTYMYNTCMFDGRVCTHAAMPTKDKNIMGIEAQSAYVHSHVQYGKAPHILRCILQARAAAKLVCKFEHVCVRGQFTDKIQLWRC